MLLSILVIILALAFLAKGGDLFVDSSLTIGRVLRVPRFVIGGTLVSLATTMPELVVSAVASSVNDPGIAIGNAIGSSICNVGLIVGAVALVSPPIQVVRSDFIERIAWMGSAGALVVIFTWNRTLSQPLAAVLLGLALAYLVWDCLGIWRQPGMAIDGNLEERDGFVSSLGQFGLGLLLIVGGSWLLVDSGQLLAELLGVPSGIIGLSVVAIGTSLPEFVTGLSSARRGVPDLSLGNIIGANVLNLFLVVGLSGSIRPLTLDPVTQFYSYGWLGIFFVVLTGMGFRRGCFDRRKGVFLLGLYACYVIGLVVVPMVAPAL